MIQSTLNDNNPTYTITTSTTWNDDVIYWYWYAGNVASGKFDVWTKEGNDLLYDGQAFGL